MELLFSAGQRPFDAFLVALWLVGFDALTLWWIALSVMIVCCLQYVVMYKGCVDRWSVHLTYVSSEIKMTCAKLFYVPLRAE